MTFSAIEKSEKEHIEEFLTSKKVKTKTEAADEAMVVDLGSDDENMLSDISSDEEAPRVKIGGGGDDDEESSEGEYESGDW